MTIAENLTALQQTKTAIKTAIEGKGQDLTGVPFTEYADKITAIQAGGGGDTLFKDFIANNNVREIKASDLDGITKVRGGAFSYLSIESVEIPSGVKSMGENAFLQCRQLVSVSLPDTLNTLVGSEFMYCTALKGITLPKGITITSGYMFRYCSSLVKVVFEGDVTEIKYGLLQNCPNVKVVDLRHCKTIPTLGASTAFSDVASFTIVVADGKKSDWESDTSTMTNWSSLKNFTIIEASEYDAGGAA